MFTLRRVWVGYVYALHRRLPDLGGMEDPSPLDENGVRPYLLEHHRSNYRHEDRNWPYLAPVPHAPFLCFYLYSLRRPACCLGTAFLCSPSNVVPPGRYCCLGRNEGAHSRERSPGMRPRHEVCQFLPAAAINTYVQLTPDAPQPPYSSHNARISRLAMMDVAGLNSTPALIRMSTFAICLHAFKFSRKRCVHWRDRRGKMRHMGSVTVRFSGRKLVAPLAAMCSAVAGCIALSGGSG